MRCCDTGDIDRSYCLMLLINFLVSSVRYVSFACDHGFTYPCCIDVDRDAGRYVRKCSGINHLTHRINQIPSNKNCPIRSPGMYSCQNSLSPLSLQSLSLIVDSGDLFHRRHMDGKQSYLRPLFYSDFNSKSCPSSWFTASPRHSPIKLRDR